MRDPAIKGVGRLENVKALPRASRDSNTGIGHVPFAIAEDLEVAAREARTVVSDRENQRNPGIVRVHVLLCDRVEVKRNRAEKEGSWEPIRCVSVFKKCARRRKIR